jgi:hypothetical protein
VLRYRQELSDPETALVAMDIILGPGVAADPASCYLPIAREHPDVITVISVCGGKWDPQGKDKIKKEMREAGVIVVESDHESAMLCSSIMKKLEARSHE